MQRLLLSDGKHSGHQNHVVILPADGGGGMAAISFTGALKIPVSTRPSQKGAFVNSVCLLHITHNAVNRHWAIDKFKKRNP